MKTSIDDRGTFAEIVATGQPADFRGVSLTFDADSIHVTGILGESVSLGSFPRADVGSAYTEVQIIAAALNDPDEPVELSGDTLSLAQWFAEKRMDDHAAEYAAMLAAGLDMGDEAPPTWATADAAERAVAIAEASNILATGPAAPF